MSFFARLSNGWKLATLSFETINRNRSLLIFPVLSGISLVLVLASFFGGTFFFAGEQIELLLNDDTYGRILAFVAIFTYYLINFFIIVFFNAALVHCAIKTLNNEATSVGDGIDFALSRIGKIFGWAVLSATVGTLLQALQETGKIGQIIAGIIGVAWSIMTFFVVPVLVYENRGVIDAVKTSGRMMREKWGESLSANVSFGLFHLLGIAGAVIVFIVLVQASFWLAAAVALTMILLVSIVVSAARMVFVAAVYNHVVGLPTGNFDSETLDGVFVTK